MQRLTHIIHITHVLQTEKPKQIVLRQSPLSQKNCIQSKDTDVAAACGFRCRLKFDQNAMQFGQIHMQYLQQRHYVTPS